MLLEYSIYRDSLSGCYSFSFLITCSLFFADVATILISLITTSSLFLRVSPSLYVNMHILVWLVFELYVNGIVVSIPF